MCFVGFFSPLTIVDYRNVIKELKKKVEKGLDSTPS